MARPPSALQRELRQNRPFRSPGHEAVIGLMHTVDVLRRQFNALAERHGITSQQYNVLRILRGAGPDGLPTLEIVERMIEQTPGITRLIDRLEKHGWVRRARGTDDRRLVRCVITASGLALLEKMDPEVESVDAESVSGLTVAEQKQLIALLDRLREPHL
jgi:DNA-binding MarR family transcriptional regulator